MIINFLNSQHMSINKKKVIIFGLLDLADLAYFYLTNDSDYDVVGFTVNNDYIKDNKFKPTNSNTEFPVVPFESIESFFSPEEFLLFAPLTGQKMNEVRKKIYEEGKNKGYTFATYVSSKCTHFNNVIGENCFILENNTIQPFVKVGNNVIMWSGNHIGHHSTIEDHVFFTSHVVLSGHCQVKESSWFGVNSTIRDGLTINKKTLIAMSSTVTKSTEENGFYLGSPAKKQDKTSIEVY